jgi:hypothetical protein
MDGTSHTERVQNEVEMTKGGMYSDRRSPSPPQYPLERKFKKPLMEKRRRERINASLSSLKQMLLNADPQQSSKLEKADILDRTVVYLKKLQWEYEFLCQKVQHMACNDSSTAYCMGYKEGYNAGAQTSLEYLAKTPLPTDLFAPHVRQQLRQGLIAYFNSVPTFPGQLSALPGSFQPRPPAANPTLPGPNFPFPAIFNMPNFTSAFPMGMMMANEEKEKEPNGDNRRLENNSRVAEHTVDDDSDGEVDVDGDAAGHASVTTNNDDSGLGMSPSSPGSAFTRIAGSSNFTPNANGNAPRAESTPNSSRFWRPYEK